ncbi:hypothetical protein [Nocardia sp. NPDC051832]|uniref:hypothetical protein n=1 Tax=Nocardia sp. NPDC051832 TaxID=3155673 RepID=UPI00341C2639
MNFDATMALTDLTQVVNSAVSAHLNAHGQRAGLVPLSWKLLGHDGPRLGVPELAGQVIPTGSEADDQRIAEGWAAALNLAAVGDLNLFIGETEGFRGLITVEYVLDDEASEAQ